MKCLPRSFYERKTVHVAKDLIGMVLVRTMKMGSRVHRLAGIIVETEAYGHIDDEASHAYRGVTERNAVMFGPVGRAYVYFTYGNHFCFNVSARSPDVAAGAVLVRGIEPIEGIDAMKKLRVYDDIHLLTSGPGRLAQALGISRQQNGVDVTSFDSELRVEQGVSRKVMATTRVGISRASDKMWRFVDPSSPFISRRVVSVASK